MNTPQQNQPVNPQASRPASPQPPGGKKTSTIALFAGGAIVLLAALIFGGIALFGSGDEPSQPTDADTSTTPGVVEEQETETNNPTDAATDQQSEGDESTATTPATEDEETNNTDTPPAESLTAYPAGIFLELAQLVSAQPQTEEDGEQTAPLPIPDDPVVLRQQIVDGFAQEGISEESVADFLAAYDTLTSETVTQALESLSETEVQALAETLTTLSESILEDSFACVLPHLSEALNLENPEGNSLSDESLAEILDCTVETLNKFGREMTSVLEDLSSV